MPRKSTKVPFVCEICNVTFWLWPCSAEQEGRGRFCSRKCQGISKRVDLIDRFFSNVGRKQPNGCILWTGCKDDHYGYGHTHTGVETIARKTAMAHRVSYELFVGPVPADLHVLHRCDTPPCINPTHLWTGTQLDNIKDRVAKGRSAKGEKSGPSKLTAQLVKEIRSRYSAGGVLYRELAGEYGMHKESISKIVRGESWRHLLIPDLTTSQTPRQERLPLFVLEDRP